MAAAPSSLGEQIREELSCSICLELFTKPKMLPCQHTFCQGCLVDHVGNSKKVWVFKCPNCRRQVRVPPKGIAGLPDNYLVTSLCERLKGVTTQPEIGPTARDLIAEGKNILGSYHSFIRSLGETGNTLNTQKQLTRNRIIQAYNQLDDDLRQRKSFLLAEVGQNDKKNLERINSERNRVLEDIKELSAVCEQAEKELEQGGDAQHTILTEVVEKHRKKSSEPTPVQMQRPIFQPTDILMPLLGRVTVQPLPSAIAPEAVINQHTSPVPTITYRSNEANCTPGRHVGGNHRQGEHESQTFGGEGKEQGKFRDPCGVAVSDDGCIFVADYCNQRIQVFTVEQIFMHKFPTIVSDKEKMFPGDVATDGVGNLWVVGRTGSAEFAVLYSKQGKMINKINLQYTLQGRGVAVDTRKNRILITETTGSPSKPYGLVLVFKADGTFVKTVGEKQGGTNKYLRYIDVDTQGNILVSDWANNCIYSFSEDGRLLLRSGVSCKARGDGELKLPCGICADSADNIIVANREHNRLELFDKTGRFLRHIATDIVSPQAVAVTTHGQLVVISTGCTVTILNRYFYT
ncbi:tripartite motif-containing protein 3-like [Branchiostoma lanceolatum]|uniref:tripartite motif-containing protein 3-like n=1 Tax=Branchiostoma lanceolatum TaxID=7740 RepID=UPI00345637A2